MNGRIIVGVDSPEIVASHKEVNKDFLAIMGEGNCGEGSVRELIGPVESVNGNALALGFKEGESIFD